MMVTTGLVVLLHARVGSGIVRGSYSSGNH